MSQLFSRNMLVNSTPAVPGIPARLQQQPMALLWPTAGAQHGSGTEQQPANKGWV